MKLVYAAAFALIVAGVAPAAHAQDFDPMAMADKNADGKVDLAEATSFSAQGWDFSDQAGAGKIKKETLPDFMQVSFASAKVDADGFVTKEAFLAAVPDRFKAADKNSDGFLDNAEIRAFLGMP
jgi:Ca2+-binding EF-hand superfamily protein